MMKILFLDIDGVLNSSRSVLTAKVLLNEFDFYGMNYAIATVDPVAMNLINRLVVKGGLKVVLSSSHRSYGDINLLNRYLHLMGAKFNLHDVTPNLHQSRTQEINDWLLHHPDYDTYCAVDDEKLDLTSVRTNPDDGLSYKNYVELCQILDINESPILVA